MIYHWLNTFYKKTDITYLMGSLRGKLFFLTYSQCYTEMSILSKRIGKLSEKIQVPQKHIIAQEQHQDGHPHLHCMISWHSRTQISFKKLDQLVKSPKHVAGHRGNYQIVRYPKACRKYVEKGGNFIEAGITLAELKKEEKVSEQISKRILEGATIEDIMENHASYLLLHVNQVEKFIQLTQKVNLSKQKVNVQRLSLTVLQDTRPLTAELSSYPAQSEEEFSANLDKLNDWFSKNIGYFLRQDLKSRPHRSKQLYLWGPPGVGKSYLFLELEKYISIHRMSNIENYDDYFENNKYGLILLDECPRHPFSTKVRPFNLINSICSGEPTILRKKGSQILKVENLPFIITSNYPILETYNYPSTRDRFVEVYLRYPITTTITTDLDDLSKLPESPLDLTNSQ